MVDRFQQFKIPAASKADIPAHAQNIVSEFHLFL